MEKHWSKPSSPLGPSCLSLSNERERDPEVGSDLPTVKPIWGRTTTETHFLIPCSICTYQPQDMEECKETVGVSPTAVLMILSPRLYSSFNSPPSVFCPDCQTSPAWSKVMQKAVPGSCNSTNAPSDRFHWQILFRLQRRATLGSEHVTEDITRQA